MSSLVDGIGTAASSSSSASSAIIPEAFPESTAPSAAASAPKHEVEFGGEDEPKMLSALNSGHGTSDVDFFAPLYHFDFDELHSLLHAFSSVFHLVNPYRKTDKENEKEKDKIPSSKPSKRSSTHTGNDSISPGSTASSSLVPVKSVATSWLRTLSPANWLLNVSTHFSAAFLDVSSNAYFLLNAPHRFRKAINQFIIPQKRTEEVEEKNAASHTTPDGFIGQFRIYSTFSQLPEVIELEDAEDEKKSVESEVVITHQLDAYAHLPKPGEKTNNSSSSSSHRVCSISTTARINHLPAPSAIVQWIQGIAALFASPNSSFLSQFPLQLPNVKECFEYIFDLSTLNFRRAMTGVPNGGYIDLSAKFQPALLASHWLLAHLNRFNVSIYRAPSIDKDYEKDSKAKSKDKDQSMPLLLKTAYERRSKSFSIFAGVIGKDFVYIDEHTLQPLLSESSNSEKYKTFSFDWSTDLDLKLIIQAELSLFGLFHLNLPKTTVDIMSDEIAEKRYPNKDEDKKGKEEQLGNKPAKVNVRLHSVEQPFAVRVLTLFFNFRSFFATIISSFLLTLSFLPASLSSSFSNSSTQFQSSLLLKAGLVTETSIVFLNFLSHFLKEKKILQVFEAIGWMIESFRKDVKNARDKWKLQKTR